MTEQIIDNKNGKLKVSNDLAFSSQTTPNDIINFYGLENVDIRDIGTGWKHYFCGNIQINDIYLSITFYFENDILRMFHFIVSDKIILPDSWNGWSESKELQKRNYYNDWLTKEIGSNRQFNWGTIGAFYDNKGGFSSIVLNYE